MLGDRRIEVLRQLLGEDVALLVGRFCVGLELCACVPRAAVAFPCCAGQIASTGHAGEIAAWIDKVGLFNQWLIRRATCKATRAVGVGNQDICGFHYFSFTADFKTQARALFRL